MRKSYSLSDLLGITWGAYEKQVHLSKNHPSTRNIHQLRVSTQKLEAVLTLSNSLRASHHSKKTIKLIKDIRQSLGPLRDTQVEAIALAKLGHQKVSPGHKTGFSNFFSKRKAKAKAKAVHALSEISIKKERKGIDRFAQKLLEIERNEESGKIQDQLSRQVKTSALEFVQAMRNINPERIKEVHALRILAKKLRYQGECVNSITGKAQYDLSNLKKIQSVAGKIQNDQVLMKTLDQFLEKKSSHKDPRVLRIRKRIQENQAKLIQDELSQLSPVKW